MDAGGRRRPREASGASAAHRDGGDDGPAAKRGRGGSRPGDGPARDALAGLEGDAAALSAAVRELCAARRRSLAPPDAALVGLRASIRSLARDAEEILGGAGRPKTEDETDETDDGGDHREDGSATAPGEAKSRDSGSSERDFDDGVEGVASSSSSSSSSDDEDDDEDSVDPVLVASEVYSSEGKLAFCCQNCSCGERRKQAFLDKHLYVRNSCQNTGDRRWSGNALLYHKGCCHSEEYLGDDYLSPIMRCRDTEVAERRRVGLSHRDIQRKYAQAGREDAQFNNEEFLPAQDCVMLTNPSYVQSCKRFHQREGTHAGKFRVLDLFSGIGSSVVILKRLGIPLEVVVHVEHDPVARYVCEFNHRDDGINHVYLETFEEVYGTAPDPDGGLVGSLIDRHGPFDLVLAGAPCQQYSGLNSRKDQQAEDSSAQYLLKVGRLIKCLNNIQESQYDVLFCSENVYFRSHEEIDRCYSTHEGGLPPLKLDAKDYGPAKRLRYYWTNIAVKGYRHKDITQDVSVDDVLGDGYLAIARILRDPEEQYSQVQRSTVKANALLASASRIDDDRMLKCKKLDGSGSPRSRYLVETYSVADREVMMGLPRGYVELPIKKLYDELTNGAFLLPETNPGKTYRDFLPTGLWHLRKKCRFKFKPCTDAPLFQILISSPLEGKADLDYYSRDQYAKRLIGNGWSLPVVEHIMEPLRDLYRDKKMLKPCGYRWTYSYRWAPFLQNLDSLM